MVVRALIFCAIVSELEAWGATGHSIYDGLMGQVQKKRLVKPLDGPANRMDFVAKEDWLCLEIELREPLQANLSFLCQRLTTARVAKCNEYFPTKCTVQ